ncbi:hypothetical protein Agub_g2439, partial [Astrephomene gubernaculifera]
MAPKKRASTLNDMNEARAPDAELDIDAERKTLMARNAALFARIGLPDAVKDFKTAVVEDRKRANAEASDSKARAPKWPRTYTTKPPRLEGPTRRSGRIAGMPAPDMAELEDDAEEGVAARRAAPRLAVPAEDFTYDGLFDLLGKDSVQVHGSMPPPDQLSEEQRAALEAQMCCSSKSRGRAYDKSVGLTCHFCRQKMLCGEDGCPRCCNRDVSGTCIGKTECGRCGSATGNYCRACLMDRYGQQLEAVRADSSWLCPHCHEEEHGEWVQHGWFCNSSFCMKMRGLRPTGIAIHRARHQGFRSVAHLLQATVLALEKEPTEAWLRFRSEEERRRKAHSRSMGRSQEQEAEAGGKVAMDGALEAAEAEGKEVAEKKE